MLIHQDNHLITERDREIKQIISDMGEVNELMHLLNDNIISQGDYIDNISTNIANSKDNCEEAKNSVEKAEEYQKGGTFFWVAGIGITSVIGAVIGSLFLL